MTDTALTRWRAEQADRRIASIQQALADAQAENQRLRHERDAATKNLSAHYLQLRHAYRDGYDRAVREGKLAAELDLAVGAAESRGRVAGARQALEDARAEIRRARLAASEGRYKPHEYSESYWGGLAFAEDLLAGRSRVSSGTTVPPDKVGQPPEERP